MIIDNCQLEMDFNRGVIYVHSSEGYTILRICGCPEIAEPKEAGSFLRGYDITLKGQKLEPYTFSWSPKERTN